jgi:hypothetical protein
MFSYAYLATRPQTDEFILMNGEDVRRLDVIDLFKSRCTEQLCCDVTKNNSLKTQRGGINKNSGKGGLTNLPMTIVGMLVQCCHGLIPDQQKAWDC